MKWVSHIAIAGAATAVISPIHVPIVIAGATAPDWLERITKTKHRHDTHIITHWLCLVAFALIIYDYRHFLLAFAIGGLLHLFCDSLTVSGVPFSPLSDRRFHLFGGRLKTGTPAEYMIAAGICAGCLLIALLLGRYDLNSGFFPFFYDWAHLYNEGVIDGHEWKVNRFRWF